MKKRFELDKSDAMFLGVCSGIARYVGVDATIVRLGVVAVTLLGAFPWTCIAYGVLAWLARPAGGAPGDTRPACDDLRGTMRDVDRRLADVETYVAGANSRLAREIDELR